MSESSLKRKISSDKEEPSQKRFGFSERKEKEIWEFILRHIRNADEGTLDPPMNPKIRDGIRIWEIMKEESDTILTAKDLHDFYHTVMLPKLATADLSIQTKACLYYGLQKDVDFEFLEQLKEVAEYRISPDNKLIGFRRKPNTGDCSSDPWYSAWSEEEEANDNTNKTGLSMADITFSDDHDWPNLEEEIEKRNGEDPMTSFIINSFNATAEPIANNNGLPVIDITPTDFEPSAAPVLTPGKTIMEALLEIAPAEPEDNPYNNEKEDEASETMPILAPHGLNTSRVEDHDDVDEIVYIKTQPKTPDTISKSSSRSLRQGAPLEQAKEVVVNIPSPSTSLELHAALQSSSDSITAMEMRMAAAFNHIERFSLNAEEVISAESLKLAGLVKKVDVALNQIVRLEKCRNEAETKAAEDSSRMSALESKLEAILQKVSNADKNNDEEQIRSGTDSLKVSTLELKVESLQNRVEAYEKESVEEKKRTATLEKQVDELQRNISELKKKVTTKNSDPGQPPDLEFSTSSVSATFSCISEPFNVSSSKSPISNKTVSNSQTVEKETEKQKTSDSILTSQVEPKNSASKSTETPNDVVTPKQAVSGVAKTNESGETPRKKRSAKDESKSSRGRPKNETPAETKKSSIRKSSHTVAKEVSQLGGFLGMDSFTPLSRRSVHAPIRYGNT